MSTTKHVLTNSCKSTTDMLIDYGIYFYFFFFKLYKHEIKGDLTIRGGYVQMGENSKFA